MVKAVADWVSKQILGCYMMVPCKLEHTSRTLLRLGSGLLGDALPFKSFTPLSGGVYPVAYRFNLYFLAFTLLLSGERRRIGFHSGEITLTRTFWDDFNGET